jgi:hypothetical protein
MLFFHIWHYVFHRVAIRSVTACTTAVTIKAARGTGCYSSELMNGYWYVQYVQYVQQQKRWSHMEHCKHKLLHLTVGIVLLEPHIQSTSMASTAYVVKLMLLLFSLSVLQLHNDSVASAKATGCVQLTAPLLIQFSFDCL